MARGLNWWDSCLRGRHCVRLLCFGLKVERGKGMD
jgi:hypothetical protein